MFRKKPSHTTLSDDLFEEKFKELTLNPAIFNHEAHLRLSYIQLKKYGLRQAISNLCFQIQAFALRVGEPNKFHHTLTVAATEVVYHFMKQSEAENFTEFLKEFPRLKSDFKQLILKHYSPALLASAQAKNKYYPPNLLPF